MDTPSAVVDKKKCPPRNSKLPAKQVARAVANAKRTAAAAATTTTPQLLPSTTPKPAECDASSPSTSTYVVVSKDFFDRVAIHGVANDRQAATKTYDTVADRLADYNEACKNKGKKRDVVELVRVPIPFHSDLGYSTGAGYDHEGAACVFNNVRDDDVSDSTLNVKSRAAFFRPVKISDKLCAFFDRPFKTAMSRHEASRLLTDYVRRRGLLDPRDKRYVFPDERLRSLFADVPPRPDDIYDDPRVRVFDLHRRLIAHHFLA